MELAKVTSKGQITIPKSIREQLKIKEGSQIIFYIKDGDIVIRNAALIALEKVQNEFEGEAERLNIKDEKDVVDMIKQIRKERKNK